ncbi:MAG TPA: 2-dehydropantoate 2-reductase N-terminal domain-containing protein, partial [Chloroflexota bacterium]
MEADRTVAILGAGAVGGYLGARLAASPFAPQVILIGRPLLVDAIEYNGLVLHEAGGNRTERLAAVSSAEHVAPADLTVLTVRTYDVSSAVLQARRLMGEKGLLLAMQNGVGTEDELAEALGRDRVLAGTLTASVTMDQPGVITRLSSSGGVALSTLNNLPVPHWVVDLFRATGLQVSTTDDYR